MMMRHRLPVRRAPRMAARMRSALATGSREALCLAWTDK